MCFAFARHERDSGSANTHASERDLAAIRQLVACNLVLTMLVFATVMTT